MDVILFHAKCPDGWCSAFIASKKYPNAQLMALDHGLNDIQVTAIISTLAGLDVLMLDYSFRTREQNDYLASTAKSLRVLDHHRTAQDTLEGAKYATFDMSRSGAGLTWDYLFGKDSKIKFFDDEITPFVYRTRPFYVSYVEDHDLWRHELPHSKIVCAYLMTLPFTKEAWNKLDSMKAEDTWAFGHGALGQIEHYVHEAVQMAQTGTLLGRQTAVLNVPYLMCSEVGNALAQTHDISLTWFERGDGMIQFSLRSVGDSDVSEVAKHFGGGGHQHASGFQLELQDGRDLIDKILLRPSYQEKLKAEMALQDQKMIGQMELELLRSAGGCAK